jgi:Rieske Fe-S protein
MHVERAASEEGVKHGLKVERRRYLRAIVAMPVIGGLLAVLSPLLRYLKPDNKPYEVPLTAPDAAIGGAQVVGSTRDLKRPWDFFYFIYVQKYVQYDATGNKATNIPGVAIRLPRKVKFANLQGYEGHPGETDIVLFSRICPHLGCIYNFEPDWHNVKIGYGGFTPPRWEQHALMACPCHFSIYDPLYPGDPGNVVSGPATRGARYFRFEIRGEDVVVTDAESGAIA